MMTPRTRAARTASTGPKVRRSLWQETSRGARVPFLTPGEHCATDESPDAVTKRIAELDATIAKDTTVRQDENLNVLENGTQEAEADIQQSRRTVELLDKVVFG